MKRVGAIGLVMVAMLLPGVGDALECVTVQRCPKGITPPACCKPPPCELFEQIRTKKAVQRLFGNRRLHERLVRDASGDAAAAAKVLEDFVSKNARKLGDTLRCPWREPYLPPPSFETNAECQIVAKLPGGDEPMSRERALRELNTCSEFIEAAYDHEQHHKDICIRSNSTARAQMRIEAYAAEESAGYAREIGRLEDRLRQYWRACSARADVKTARAIANAGIAALKK
jgi:hypothetical protein